MARETKLLRVSEVAEILGGISAATVRRMVARGELAPPVSVQSMALYDLADVMDSVAYLKVAARVKACQEQSAAPGSATERLQAPNEAPEKKR